MRYRAFLIAAGAAAVLLALTTLLHPLAGPFPTFGLHVAGLFAVGFLLAARHPDSFFEPTAGTVLGGAAGLLLMDPSRLADVSLATAGIATVISGFWSLVTLLGELVARTIAAWRERRSAAGT